MPFPLLVIQGYEGGLTRYRDDLALRRSRGGRRAHLLRAVAEAALDQPVPTAALREALQALHALSEEAPCARS